MKLIDNKILLNVLNGYVDYFPNERNNLRILLQQIKAHQDITSRRNFQGHITGSAIILSPDKHQVLLIFHNHFQLWQQPGGHWDDDETPLQVARREAEEETHVKIKAYLPIDSKSPLIPLDIDTHKVSARPLKDEPAHWHHDIRYLFLASDTALKHQANEVSAAVWYNLDDPLAARISVCIEKIRDLHMA